MTTPKTDPSDKMETLAEEFARLIDELLTGEVSKKQEAWNYIAEFAVENHWVISAALTSPPKGEVGEEEIARAIWESQRSRIQNRDGINARLTWRSNDAPDLFWNSFILDARASLSRLSRPVTGAEGVRNAALKEAAKVASDWIAVFGNVKPEYIDARQWATDAIKDITDQILALSSAAPSLPETG